MNTPTYIACVAWIAAIWLPTGTHAQSNATLPTAAMKKQPAYAFAAEGDAGSKGRQLYTMKFDGGTVGHLVAVLKGAFGEDNFLCTEAVANEPLPAFEMQRVTLSQLADSIDFLGGGALDIQVTEKNESTPTNIWRISTRTVATEFAAPKMKAVAAPYLFADERSLLNFLKEAENLRAEWLNAAQKEIAIRRETQPWEVRIAPPRVEIRPISGQKVIVLIGTEDGIAGMESFVKACEQRMAEEKMRPGPVAAPADDADPKPAVKGAKATKCEP